MTNITLQNPIFILLKPAVTVQTTNVIKTLTMDSGYSVNAEVSVTDSNGNPNKISLLLWDSTTTPSYSTCGVNGDGNWLDSDVNARISQLLLNSYGPVQSQGPTSSTVTADDSSGSTGSTGTDDSYGSTGPTS